MLNTCHILYPHYARSSIQQPHGWRDGKEHQMSQHPRTKVNVVFTSDALLLQKEDLHSTPLPQQALVVKYRVIHHGVLIFNFRPQVDGNLHKT